MRVTPLDIIQKSFTASRRGYDSDEVRIFLDEVRDSLEEGLKENQRLREQLRRQHEEIEELRSHESDIKETLLLAKRVSGDLQRSARREADVIVGEARLESEKIIIAATEERGSMQAEIIHLRAQRARLLADMRATLETYTAMLDELHDDKHNSKQEHSNEAAHK